MSTVGLKGNKNDDTLDIKLRNKQDDKAYHHWIVHNFRPTKLGEIEFNTEASDFAEFELTGTFSHIDYLSGLPSEITYKNIIEENEKAKKAAAEAELEKERSRNMTPEEIEQ